MNLQSETKLYSVTFFIYYIYSLNENEYLKPFFEHIDTGIASSIKVKTYTQQMIDVPLHYHPEHEIVYIQKGQGNLFLADVEEDFSSGDVFFIRGSIPHLFEDAAMHTGKRLPSRVTVIQYRQNLFERMYPLPEFAQVSRLESMIGYGIKMQAGPKLRQMLGGLEEQSGLLLFNGLIALLHEIIHERDHRFLGLTGKTSSSNHVSYLRLQKMHAFLSKYFYREISIEEVASLLHMSKTSFCRFLKRETGKTFSEHLNYYRVGHACSLLRNSTENVMEICYSCGYNNAAHFFRQFKKYKEVAPLEYRKMNALAVE